MKNRDGREPYDMTERATRRTDEEATQEARQAESDDQFGQGAHPGLTDDPSGDDWAENKVSTSLDDE